MNSRPWENLELREQYREDNPDCELTRFLAGTKWNKIKLAYSCSWDSGHQCHHIWRGAIGARVDVIENLIMTCVAAHRFCHMGPEGTIACWYAKNLKGEFDPVSMNEEWMKRCPLGWVESKLELVDEHFARMGRELLG